MRATGIRWEHPAKDVKLTTKQMEELCDTIIAKTAKAGFHTNASVINSTSIKIGLHMQSFRVITKKLGYNARVGRYVKSPKGYKRTDVPTYQRVEFNDLINGIFDKYELVATIKSGAFTVRARTGRRSEHDWKSEGADSYSCDSGNYGASTNAFGEVLSDIYTEREARELLDSDRLEREHKLATADARREKSREYRRRIRLFENAERVIVAGFYSYNNEDTKNGKRMTHRAFQKMLVKLNRWDQRRVRQASIAATAELAVQS